MKRVARVVAAVLVLILIVSSAGCTEPGARDDGELKILSHSMTVREFAGSAPQSMAVVIGRAQNVGNVDIKFGMIAVNFYDKNKNLIAKASAIRENLRPGETWDFSITTVGPDAWKITSYDIAASTKQ